MSDLSDLYEEQFGAHASKIVETLDVPKELKKAVREELIVRLADRRLLEDIINGQFKVLPNPHATDENGDPIDDGYMWERKE